uniref:Uncharacterized protein n=1 Tax=Cynoglossus semilaevis TaxID=244447 RepID=A0A3P8WTS0_CYNSE
MNLHQVLTGAVNPGDNCFSVGSVNHVPFTAYASGCDVVILGSDFERLQIIPGAKHGNIQVGCVDCSLQGGQVRVMSVSLLVMLLFLFLPQKFNCQWQKTRQFVLQSMVRNLAWHPTGTSPAFAAYVYINTYNSCGFILKELYCFSYFFPGSSLLTGSNCLQLWSSADVTDDQTEDGAEQPDLTMRDTHCAWTCIWESK